jgi:phosphoribosylformylglycinamidine (FGAM) synthase-like amidotransferase family enzyme
MMPHPERAADSELNNEDGLELFKSLINHMSIAKA